MKRFFITSMRKREWEVPFVVALLAFTIMLLPISYVQAGEVAGTCCTEPGEKPITISLGNGSGRDRCFCDKEKWELFMKGPSGILGRSNYGIACGAIYEDELSPAQRLKSACQQLREKNASCPAIALYCADTDRK